MNKVHVILMIAMVVCSLIGIANAEDTNQIKSYTYEEGVAVAKDTGKPILSGFPSVLPMEYFNEIIIGDFVYIPITNIIADPIAYRLYKTKWCCDVHNVDEEGELLLLILDSNGREITRIASFSDGRLFIQMDSDGNEIASINMSKKEGYVGNYNEFILKTLEYSKTKKGKIQRLPQEKGLVSVKDVHDNFAEYNCNFVTVNGNIRDINYGANYEFQIDDGTGVIDVTYIGGLGDIEEGDKIFVNGYYSYGSYDGSLMILSKSASKTPIDVSTDHTKSNDDAPIPKTPDLGAMFAITELLAVAYLLRRR